MRQNRIGLDRSLLAGYEIPSNPLVHFISGLEHLEIGAPLDDSVYPSVTPLDLQPPASRTISERGNVKISCGPSRVASKPREGLDEGVLSLHREGIEFPLCRLQERELLLPGS